MRKTNLFVLTLLLVFVNSGIFAQTHLLNQASGEYQTHTFDIKKMTNENNGKNGDNDTIISNNAFLQGLYVEVGMAQCGCFGTTQSQPAGFHGNMEGPLGFVADP